MARALSRTGLPGEPAHPLIVSYGAVWPGGEAKGAAGVELAATARSIFDVVGRIKGEHRANGWLPWDEWLLLVDGPDVSIQNVRYRNGAVETEVLDAFLRRLSQDLDRVQLTSGRWGGMTVGMPEIRFHNADVASVSVSVRCPTDEAVRSTFDALRSLLIEHHGSTGFVHVDSIADPYTEVVTRTHASSNEFERQVHGYYAVVYLGPGQLEELGGLSRVRADAPCATAEPVDDGLLCQLVDSPLELTAEAVQAWRRCLAPVLRRGFPLSADMVGVPLTPLARPVWLFEGPPVQPDLPRGLLEGYVPPGAERPEMQVEADPGSEGAVVRVELSSQSDSGLSELVAAHIHAWAVAGQAGRLHGVEGKLASATRRPTDTNHAVEFDVDLGDLTPENVAATLPLALVSLPQPIERITAVHLGGRERVSRGANKS